MIYSGSCHLVCDDALDEHVWVSEQAIALQEATVSEALQCDNEIPCVVQWRCCGSRHQPASTTTC